MDPSGGWFLWILIAIIIAIVLLWVFAPHAWALGISAVLVVAFVIFVVTILSGTRFT